MTHDTKLIFKSTEPLKSGDTLETTYGCRHSNWSICKHAMSGKCAFASKDKICKAPPMSWKKNYELLKAQEEKNKK